MKGYILEVNRYKGGGKLRLIGTKLGTWIPFTNYGYYS